MHIKRLAAPRTWKIRRKEGKFIVAINPGKPKEFSVPLLLVIRDLLGLVEKGKEGKYVIRKGLIKVDGKVRKDYRYPVGLFDTIEIEKIGKYYRLVFDKKRRLDVVEINKDESNLKIVKIIGKTLVKGKMQYNLSDSRNLLSDEKYNVKDSLLIEVPSQKVIEHLPFKEGNLAYLIGGKHVGRIAKIIKIKGKYVKLAKDNEEFWTMAKNLIVVGKEKEKIKVVKNE